MTTVGRRKITDVELWDGRTVWSWGTIDGLPAFKWGWAPEGLATRDQLHGMEPQLQLSRNQDPYAVLIWNGPYGFRTADLYRTDQAAPKQPFTFRRKASLTLAYLAHFWCTSGHEVDRYVHPRHRMCADCLEAADLLDEASGVITV